MCVIASHDEMEMLERLEKFWSAYPRKEGKGKLEAVWKEMLPSESLLEAMLKALEDQKKSPAWKRENGRFIPYPAKWVAERRWENIIEVEKPTPAPEMKRETYTPEDLARFDQAREKGLAEIKKVLHKEGKLQ